MLATRQTLRASATLRHPRASAVSVRASLNRNAASVQKANVSPVMVALMMALSGPMIVEPFVQPPAAHADEAADKRAAEKARRKAMMKAYREQAEAGTPAKKTTAQADAEIEAENERRRAAAAANAERIKAASVKAYSEGAAKAVQEVPPLR
mmetsp:Transcript_25021/g.63433  ORF Transcript_25021/g.63433 Transcript_25021/m.63433 type:complete len:152 (-) Transcript_25021:546-1001(-)|eukprot:CAMPEP_0202862750 /NCGR_PEP_ID=MMETSP1391-20130828/3669_1 /ASSEMBLY_ACC=CAM_ASM_000867 /TAXON_ID=1034604 /ORGANISM="Chlamydomonas leiostraca, Strain SAG 11-49" /LENGTH=151 /DNA_ID=CAMNT_0049542327 /DNA_START=95 /DNA_END=550 /DNA_ORIENTATION=-